jgi:hypothetical protein
MVGSPEQITAIRQLLHVLFACRLRARQLPANLFDAEPVQRAPPAPFDPVPMAEFKESHPIPLDGQTIPYPRDAVAAARQQDYLNAVEAESLAEPASAVISGPSFTTPELSAPLLNPPSSTEGQAPNGLSPQLLLTAMARETHDRQDAGVRKDVWDLFHRYLQLPARQAKADNKNPQGPGLWVPNAIMSGPQLPPRIRSLIPGLSPDVSSPLLPPLLAGPHIPQLAPPMTAGPLDNEAFASSGIYTSKDGHGDNDASASLSRHPAYPLLPSV